jgi:hypothetical protein
MPINTSEISFTLDIEDELETVPPRSREKLKRDIGKKLIDSIKQDMDAGRSSVTGQRWTGLSKDYKEFKRKKVGSSSANLKLFNNMRPAILQQNVEDGVKIEITDSSQIPKASNHLLGDTLPQRQFLPDDSFGQQFRSGIMSEVKAMIRNKQVKQTRQPRGETDLTATESTPTRSRDIQDSLSATFDVDAFIRDLIG